MRAFVTSSRIVHDKVDLDAQLSLQRVLKGWLAAHVPTAVALLDCCRARRGGDLVLSWRGSGPEAHRHTPRLRASCSARQPAVARDWRCRRSGDRSGCCRLVCHRLDEPEPRRRARDLSPGDVASHHARID